MKKLLLILITSVMIIGCEKSKDASDDTNKTFTVKYEIITSQDISPPFGDIPIMYTNGTGQIETVNNFSTGKSWEKTVTVTTTTRPLPLILFPDPISLKSAGTVTGNIYINGIKKATLTNSTTNTAGIYVATILLNYQVL
jgi:hypothetical protein